MRASCALLARIHDLGTTLTSLGIGVVGSRTSECSSLGSPDSPVYPHFSSRAKQTRFPPRPPWPCHSHHLSLATFTSSLPPSPLLQIGRFFQGCDFLSKGKSQGQSQISDQLINVRTHYTNDNNNSPQLSRHFNNQRLC